MIKKETVRVSIISIIGNFLLALIKFLAGFLANSGAMISDAVHTVSDVFTTIIAFVGVYIGNIQEDNSHRYGHERLECIASLILAFIPPILLVKSFAFFSISFSNSLTSFISCCLCFILACILFITGLESGINGLKILIKNDDESILTPGVFALIAAIISIIVKEIMYQYTIRVAKKIKSDALKADAWHHRSDALSSIGALIGIILSRLGFKFFDPLASVLISALIIKVSIEIFLESVDKLVDKSCDNEKVEKIKNVVLKEKQVLAIDDIKTRIFANKIYVDIEIALDGNKTLNETHAIAEKVHDRVEKEFDDIKHIMVHVNPYKERKQDEK